MALLIIFFTFRNFNEGYLFFSISVRIYKKKDKWQKGEIMHTEKNSLTLRIRHALARVLILVLLAGVWSVPTYAGAATITEPAESGSSLADKNRLEQIPVGTSGSTWKKVGSKIRLRGSNGKYKTGFVKKDGKYYYFDSKGNLKTGFITYKGKTWFASYVQGAMGKGQILTGIVYVKGLYYFMDPASKPYPGAISTGFQEIAGRRYYFNEEGHMVTGWFKSGSSTYYANCNKKENYGALLTGVQKIGQTFYRFDSSGRLLGTVTYSAKPGYSRSLADFAVIHQHPELPTGCEATSLTMVLNYYGFPANKLDIAVNYLPKGPIGSTDFRNAFLGDPRNSWSRGCYAPAIVKTANSYLAAQKSEMKAVDISGRELTSLSAYTNANIPVMVWGTSDCRTPYVSATWYINGEKLIWVSPEHCMVLLGFPNGMVKVADPDSGNIRLYDLNLFRSRYNALHKQGVIIQ